MIPPAAASGRPAQYGRRKAPPAADGLRLPRLFGSEVRFEQLNEFLQCVGGSVPVGFQFELGAVVGIQRHQFQYVLGVDLECSFVDPRLALITAGGLRNPRTRDQVEPVRQTDRNNLAIRRVLGHGARH